MVRALFFAILLCVSFADHALAREVVERFISSITVNTDGSLDVVEEISVSAEGQSIRRGILRDFPTDYKYKDGTSVRVGFDVKSVARNGKTEDWSTERMANGVRLRIGSADRLLQPGIHTFIISYSTNRQLGFFEDYDELYWNVTGNDWTFPINDAHVNITLPNGAKVKQYSLFTGRFGEAGKDAVLRRNENNSFAAATTRPLDVGEGFTVAVAWQKGLVASPTANQRLWWWIQDNLGFGLLAATLLSVLAYFTMMWARVGRDPPKGNVFPLFKPPEGLGPAGVRYVWKQGYDNQGFAAAMIGLAVKGRLKIENERGDFAITKLTDQGPSLTNTETALFRHFPAGRTELQNENHQSIRNAQAAVAGVLEQEYNGTMFVKNLGWFALGAAISVVGILISGFAMPSGEGAMLTFAGVFAAVWWGVLLSFAYGIVKGFWSSNFFSIVGRLFRLLFLVPFAVAGVGVPALTLFESGASPAMLILVVMAFILGVVNFVFYKLMPAPTPMGRQILDQIEGFRMYMKTAEEKRLDALNPPEKTPQLFEKYLPYAIALDCENEWNAKFAAVLAAAAAAGASAPYWYSGTHSNWGTGGFASDLNNSFSNSISSAATPPGSTSGSSGGFSGGGSSGGGFSGGGGGGGGGSGW